MSIANKVCDFFAFWYYQYTLVTALYMLEFWERAVFSILGVGSLRSFFLTFSTPNPKHFRRNNMVTYPQML